MRLIRFSLFLSLSIALILPWLDAGAAALLPAATVSTIRTTLFDAQSLITDDPALATQKLDQARVAYTGDFAESIRAAAPQADARIRNGFEQAGTALAQQDAPAFAAAHAQVWTGVLAGSYAVVEAALRNGDGATAQRWLSAREFRTLTRFARPSTDATLAVGSFAAGKTGPEDTLLALRADLFDTYQARLNEALQDLDGANASGFATRRAGLAASAQGYFHILAPAYADQRGPSARDAALASFADLRGAALAGTNLNATLKQVNVELHNFRAAPLSAAEQSRRAGQLLRFLSLVPVEYKRGVVNGQVTRDLEIQEASTFHAGAYAAFGDLENLLDARDHDKTVQSRALFTSLAGMLDGAGKRSSVASPDEVQKQADSLAALLKATIPAEWLNNSAQGDFDVIASMLDQMETAARSGDYTLAESARLEAYAILESGPEARLVAFAPQLKLRIEELFWNGQGEHKGLAHLIKNGAGIKELQSTRADLDAALQESQTVLGQNDAPLAVATNAGLIVFREALEAMLILASLMSSMKRSEERRYRTPMWVGALAAVLATALTWVLAHDMLQSMARYGETLEAIVSLVAIVVLLLILNWFFHKKYWTGWIARFHVQKRKLISGEAGLWLGLITLGFTSVYREGFEIVLFLQALVLAGGITMVILGVGVAMLAVLLIGLVTFRLQVNLPYKNILIITGVLVGGVLLQMVGNSVHVMQVIGWLPIHAVESLPLPYWLGTWFGIFATWEGLGLQALSATYVIGSYYMAEWLQKRQTHRAEQHNPSPQAQQAVLEH